MSAQVQSSFGLIGEGPDEKISWVLEPPKLRNPPPPTTEQSKATLVFFKKTDGKKNLKGWDPSQTKSRDTDSFLHLRATDDNEPVDPAT